MNDTPAGSLNQQAVTRTTSAHLLKRIPWTNFFLFVLLFHALLLIILVLIPFYGSGMHLMTEGQIYQKNNCCNLAEWYPLWADYSAVIDWALYAWVGFLYIGTPLLFWASVLLVIKWRNTTWRTRLVRLAIVMLSLATAILLSASGRNIAAWLID